MDLKKLDSVAACENGRDIVIRDAEGIETDITFNVVGVDSKVFRNENAKLQAKLKLAEKRGKELDADEVESEYCRMIAKCTLGWQNLTEGGKPIPFSEEKATEIYEGFPLIKSQVFAALFDRAAFLGNLQSAS
jgi:hypothetical protein